jgi:glycine dehydrogenase subunit 1
MRYVPHTADDVRDMLATIGVGSVDDLFRSVPRDLLAQGDFPFPPRLSEQELMSHAAALAAKNTPVTARPCFLGGGAYRHYIPAIVDAIASRGEFLTAYTPYQPEASQGSLQAFFEFQSMVADLFALDVSNASLYDGATALVESLVMVQATRGGPGQPGEARKKILVSRGIHPEYIETLRTYYANLPYTIEEVPLTPAGLAGEGMTSAAEVAARARDAIAFAFQSPTFHGTIEDARALSLAAHEAGAAAVQVCDPISLAILAPPGETGVDVACAEGQPLGNYPSFGGPYLGLIGARMEFLRRLPGRLVGETRDRDGKRGYVLTLQTREQHIRRERATSNICTNVGLVALRATVYLAALGKEGLRDVARICAERAHYAAAEIAKVPGYRLRYPGAAFWREFAVRCPRPAAEVNRGLAARGITGGLDLGRFDPDAADTMLVCVTEMTPREHIDRLVGALAEIR